MLYRNGVISTLDDVLRRTTMVVDQVVRPAAARIDREAQWPVDGIRALQKAGLGGLVVPTAVGGLGMGLAGLARVCESIGSACPSTAISFGMHHVAAAVIAAKTTPGQTREYLEPIVRGDHLTTLALSEPGSGAHFYFPQAQLTRANDGSLSVSGEKSFVTNGGHADSYVVSVAGGEAASPGEFSCVLVPGTSDGLRWAEPWNGLGMRGNDARGLVLSNVALSAKNLLGQPGDQIWYVFHVVAPYFLVAMSGTYLGIATAALDEARAHLSARRYSQDGSVLAHQPILQHRLGTLWASVMRSRALLYYAADCGDRASADALPALCSAKAEIAECAVEVTNEVMTLMGGRGYGSHSAIQQMLRDARAAHVMAPTTDVLRTWTGRALLDVPLLSE